MNSLKVCVNNGGSFNYPLLACNNQTISPQEVILANSDKSICLLDLNKGVLQPFNPSGKNTLHTNKIETIVYSSLVNKDNANAFMPAAVLSASEDRTLKIWDRTSGECAITMRYKNQPIYSVDTNKNIIVAGTSEDIVFWDVRNTKVPMEILDESHNEDITQVCFHPTDT